MVNTWSMVACRSTRSTNCSTESCRTRTGTTIGGLVFSTLGHVPRNGEELEFDGWHLTAVEVVGRRVRRVKIGRAEAVADAGSAADAAAGGSAATTS